MAVGVGSLELRPPAAALDSAEARPAAAAAAGAAAAAAAVGSDGIFPPELYDLPGRQPA